MSWLSLIGAAVGATAGYFISDDDYYHPATTEKRLLWAAGGAALGAGAGYLGSSIAGWTRVDDGRPIHVAGDSYAVGIADALRKQHPKRAITSSAVGGVAAYFMQPLQERDEWQILSAGTNDAAGVAPPRDIAQRIMRVLGPYGTGAAKRGGVAYIVPHSKMGGALGQRVTETMGELALMLDQANPDRLALVSMQVEPGPDKIHPIPAGYGTLARDAVDALSKLPS